MGSLRQHKGVFLSLHLEQSLWPETALQEDRQ